MSERNRLQSTGTVRPIASTAGYYLSFIGLGLSMAVLGPALKGLTEQTGSTLAGISVLFTAKSLGYLIGIFGGGHLFDRFPGHRLLAGAFVLMAAAFALVPFVPMVSVLAGLIFLTGFADGIVDVGGITLVVWVNRHNPDPYQNGLHFAFGVGAFLWPIIIGWAIMRSGSIEIAFLLVAVMVLVPALWLIRLHSPVAEHLQDEVENGKIDPIFVGLLVLFFFTFVAAESSFGGWIKSYVMESGFGDERSATFLNSAFWGGLTLGRLAGVWISTRYTPNVMLSADIFGCLVSLGIMIAFPGNPTALWIGTIGMGVSVATMFATGVNFAERRMALTGKVTSMLLVGGSIGSMTLPWLIGQLFERIGPHVTMYAIFVNMMVSGMMFLVTMAYARRVPERLRKPVDKSVPVEIP